MSCFYGLGTELFTFFGGETGMVLEFPMPQTHLCPAHDALLNEEVEYFIGYSTFHVIFYKGHLYPFGCHIFSVKLLWLLIFDLPDVGSSMDSLYCGFTETECQENSVNVYSSQLSLEMPLNSAPFGNRARVLN